MWKKNFAFIFQLSEGALVAPSCFAQLHQIQSLDDHIQHQGAHFHKHDYHHQIDIDGCDSPKWRVACLIFWLSLGVRRLCRHSFENNRYGSFEHKHNFGNNGLKIGIIGLKREVQLATCLASSVMFSSDGV